MEADFVEAPSQMLEELMRSPQVLAAIREALQDRRSDPRGSCREDEQGVRVRARQLGPSQDALSAISYEIYSSDPTKVDPDAITDDAFRKYSKLVPIPGTHFWAAFGHLGGYSSAYYTYLWDKVIAEDFASQFDKSNYLSDGPSMRYRKTVLEPGGTESANDLVRNFLGRAQNMDAFKKWMGEEFETAAPEK